MKLIEAIKNNDVGNVKMLLESEDVLDPNVLNPNDFKQAFGNACQNGNIEMVKLLLADNRITDDRFVTTNMTLIMFRANKNGHIEIVKLLFEHMKDLKSSGFLGFPLSRYIDSSSPDIFKEITDFRKDPFSYIKKKGNLGEKSLIAAIKMLLSSAGADPSENGNKAFFSAVRNGHLEVLKQLWEDQRVRITMEDEEFERAKNEAASNKHKDIVKFLNELQYERLPRYERLQKQRQDLQESLKDLKTTNDHFAFKEKLITILPSFYENNHRKFDQWIITDLPGVTKDNPLDNTFLEPSKIVYNLDRYDEGVHIENEPYLTKGLPLATEEDIPISYVVHLPQGEVKSVLVQVYGGGNTENKSRLLDIPTPSAGMDAKLQQEGVAIIHLNLIDLLTPHTSFDEMDQTLHERLHQSIHTFYEVIKNHPEKLDASLARLKDKPLTLRGSSFGGRTTVKHAELYPQTFDYYISFDGALSPKMLRKSDIIPGTIRYKTDRAMESEAWSSPTNGIENIKDPILLVHNVDDNNVNLKVTMDWYKKADAAGKSPLIRMLIMDKGNAFNYREHHNTGHYLASDVKSVERLSYLITQFTSEGPSNLPEYTNWVGYKYEMVANQNYISASVEESFIAQAHRLYRKTKSVMPTDETLSDIYYTFHYLHNIDPKALMNDLSTLHDAGLLTDEVLTRGLQAHLKAFLNYFKESEGLIDQMPNDLNMDALITKPLLEKYKAALLEEPSGEHLKRSPLLTSLFLANPSLIQKVSNYQLDPAVQHDMEQAKDNFRAVIKEEKQLIRSLWRAAARETLQREKGRKTLRLGQVAKQEPSPPSPPAQEERIESTSPGKKPA